MAGDRKGGLGLAISRSNLAACALGGEGSSKVHMSLLRFTQIRLDQLLLAIGETLKK